MQLFVKDSCIKICLKNRNPYVLKAVQDLRADFQRISEYCVFPEIVQEECDWCIVIEENTADDFDPIQHEGYSIKTDGSKIRIAAEGYLGTMWGIYTFCETVLGVDPCYIFNDLEIAKREALETENLNIVDKPTGFGFRGVFINDEDLLTGFKDGGGIRYLDFPFYGVTVEKGVMEKVVETVLRLKLNLVIPASFLDLDNPPEKCLADCVAERGIYLSQHHIEPLGLSHHTFGNYCRKYHKTGECSYLTNPELMEEAWTFYARKWAEYDNVVWQIGLRGKGDRPVWQESTPTEEELRHYGQFISKAYRKQKEIVLEATKGKAKHFTSTLWMEGSMLMKKGFLEFPEDVIIVFADAGPNQMYGEEYDTVIRKKDRMYGIYYHLQFYSSGPHLAPQTGLDKLFYNIDLARRNGENAYAIINISNTREFVFELGAYGKMLWDMTRFSKEAYLDAYCRQYGSCAADAKHLITKYYNHLPEIDAKYLSLYQSHLFHYSASTAPNGIKNFVLKDGSVLEVGERIIRKFHQGLGDELCHGFYTGLKPVVPIYEQLCCELETLANKLPQPLKKHVQVKWLLYANTLLGIYKWYVNLYEAKQYCDLYDSENMKAALNRACDSLEFYLRYRKCAEYGYFENWFRGDLKMDTVGRLYSTRRLLCQTVPFC